MKEDKTNKLPNKNKRTDESPPPAYLPKRSLRTDTSDGRDQSKNDSSTVSCTGSPSAASSSRSPETRKLMLAPASHSISPSSVGATSITTTSTTTARDTKSFHSSRSTRRGKTGTGPNNRGTTTSRKLRMYQVSTTDDAQDGGKTIVSPGSSVHVEEVSRPRSSSPGLENVPEVRYNPDDNNDIELVVAPTDDDNDEDEENHDNSTELIVAAEVVPDDDDVGERLERQIEEEVEARMNQRDRNKIVAEAVVVDHSTVSSSGLSRRSRGYIFLVLVLVVVGIVTGVAYPLAVSGASPSPSDNFALLRDELDPLIVRTEADLIPFESDSSAQHLALTWMSTDNISLDRSRSNRTRLERYVMAVLYYSSSLNKLIGLRDTDVCSWANDDRLEGKNPVGIYCEDDIDPSTVTHVQLAFFEVNGTIPWELSLLSNLKELYLEYNELTGTIPTELCQLPALEVLSIAHNQLTGTLPEELGQLTLLTRLTADKNRFTGTIPTVLGQLVDLETFWISDNFLRGTVPTELGHLTSVKYFYIKNNTFTGTLPTELGQLTSVQEFYAHSSNLNGTLPTELGQLLAVNLLVIWNNDFTGPLPSELGQLTSVTDMWCTENNFTGTLPTELGRLTSMKMFGIHDNGLTGPLPTELGQITALIEMWIGNNFFTGTVPTELSHLPDLRIFKLANNHLIGFSNDTLCSSGKQWTDLESDCLPDDGGTIEIVCSCCSLCCNPEGSTCTEL